MFIGVAEDDSDTENPMPPFDIYGPSNLTQETLQAVPWGHLGAHWPRLLGLRKRLATSRSVSSTRASWRLAGMSASAEPCTSSTERSGTSCRGTKKRLRKFVSTFKKHIIHNGFAYHEDSDVDSDEANTDATDYDSDGVYIKGPAGYNRYTDEFKQALGRFQTIKAKARPYRGIRRTP